MSIFIYAFDSLYKTVRNKMVLPWKRGVALQNSLSKDKQSNVVLYARE